MSKDDFKRRRRLVAAKHDPPLVHISDAAVVLNISVGAAHKSLKYYELKKYYMTGLFSKGTYYETAAVEHLAERLAHNRDY